MLGLLRSSVIQALCLALVITFMVKEIQAEASRGRLVMDKVDEQDTVKDEYVEMSMRLVSKTGRERNRHLTLEIKQYPGKLYKGVFYFYLPKDIAKTWLLIWEKEGNKDDDRWLYLPAIKKVKRIASSNIKDKFVGSDYAYEDLQREKIDLHEYNLVRVETLDGHKCDVVEAIAIDPDRKKNSGYKRRIIWVRRDIHRPVKIDYYGAASGKLEKTQIRTNIVRLPSGKYRANDLKMVNHKKGSTTYLLIKSRKIDQGVSDHNFTQGFLLRRD